MSRVRADRYTNSSGVGAPEFTHGAVMVGLVTASTLTATTLNVSGTLTYEDVTNVDSVGIITAQSGIRMGIGSTIGPASDALRYRQSGSAARQYCPLPSRKGRWQLAELNECG